MKYLFTSKSAIIILLSSIITTTFKSGKHIICVDNMPAKSVSVHPYYVPLDMDTKIRTTTKFTKDNSGWTFYVMEPTVNTVNPKLKQYNYKFNLTDKIVKQSKLRALG